MIKINSPTLKGETTIPKASFRGIQKDSFGGGKTLIVILGPTAVGKTAVAIEFAKALDTEIISADSRQFFREMSIGTAKPSKEELAVVKHHFINSLSVTDEYNVGMFEQDALKILDTLFQKKEIVIMAGGSGLYINAVCNGFDELPQANNEIRAKLAKMYKREGIEYLQNTLKKLDKEHFRKVDIKNPHRLIRAIEICMTTGKTYSELRKGEKKKRGFGIIKIGLNMARITLYKRINARVDEMIKLGLLEEVKSLAPIREGGKAGTTINSLQTVGYKELFDHLEGKTDLKQAIELIKQNTRNFAKRQMTWFLKDKEIKWFEPDESGKILEYIQKGIP
ncbi:MAG: tRNA (adenosine(37)-N6)-dimethylallyltransferase MiaA [Bacteroidetes bacterium]|nr:MAG: tRNA (adenosine(37)-N6)-dimethylallyltransferase MiaA [Bacteroidota bacterium]